MILSKVIVKVWFIVVLMGGRKISFSLSNYRVFWSLDMMSLSSCRAKLFNRRCNRVFIVLGFFSRNSPNGRKHASTLSLEQTTFETFIFYSWVKFSWLITSRQGASFAFCFQPSVSIMRRPRRKLLQFSWHWSDVFDIPFLRWKCSCFSIIYRVLD